MLTLFANKMKKFGVGEFWEQGICGWAHLTQTRCVQRTCAGMERNMKWFKSVGCIGILAAIVIGLCACGKAEDRSDAANANNMLARENVYAVTSEDIVPWISCNDSYVSVQSAVCMDNGVCAVMELQDRMENEEYYGVLTADEELSNMKIVPLELPDNQQTMDENIKYSYFLATADGRVYALQMSDDGQEERQRAEVCCWNISGQMLWQSDISEMYNAGGEATVYGFYASGDNSVNFLFADDGIYKIHIAEDGELSLRERLSDRSAEIISECFEMWSGMEGTIRLMYPKDEERSKTSLVDYNVDTDTFGEPYELPFTFERGVFEWISAGTVSDLIYAERNGISVYNAGDEQASLKMNYINSDRNITYIDALLELDASHFFAFYKEDNEGTLKAGVFSHVKPQEVAEKKVVVLGGKRINDAVKQRVIAFNRTNDRYRIVLKEYAYDENTNSYPQLNNDIVSGNMPDILVAEGLPVDRYIEKGLIADLWPLIKQDEELAEAEFMENVFETYSVDGKLMYVIPDFIVDTVVAKTSTVGDGADWSLEKVTQILAEMDQRTQFMSEMTGDMFMEAAMSFYGNEFLEMEAGKCSFESDEFIALMKFAATLPKEIDPDALYDGDDYWEGYEAQYRDERTLLMELRIDSLNRSLNYQLNGYMGEDYIFVGFPGSGTESGKGAYIYGNNLMVISSKSKLIEGAWEFARYYLTDEYQEGLDWGLPVNKKIFLEKAEKLTEHMVRIDENGTEVESDDTLYYHGEEMPVMPMTQAQLEQLVAYVESVKGTSFADEEILRIIGEEMEALFAGDKTAEESAKLIQNRAQLYMNERQ